MSPKNTPRAAGSKSGVFSPRKYGSATRPSLPAGVAGGLGVEPRVGVLARPEVPRALGGEPFHERAARRHAAVQEEEPGHVVVVDVQPRIGRKPVDGEEDVSRPADLEDQLPRRRLGGERRGHVVGAARDHRRARGEPRLARRSARHPAHHLVGRAHGGEPALIDPGRVKRGAIPVAPAGVPEPGLERPVLLEAPLAREPPRDVVVGAEDAPDRAGDGAPRGGQARGASGR